MVKPYLLIVISVIIDEFSMLKADMLYQMDFRLWWVSKYFVHINPDLMTSISFPVSWRKTGQNHLVGYLSTSLVIHCNFSQSRQNSHGMNPMTRSIRMLTHWVPFGISSNQFYWEQTTDKVVIWSIQISSRKLELGKLVKKKLRYWESKSSRGETKEFRQLVSLYFLEMHRLIPRTVKFWKVLREWSTQLK